MRFLFRLIISLILITMLIVGAIAFVIYNTFFNPTPVEYSYMNPADQITSIEIAEVSFAEGVPSTTGVGYITDKEAFISDLNEVQCYSGINLGTVPHLIEDKKIDGIVIHYADGSSEIITAYLSIGVAENSTGISGDMYSFDVKAFNELFNEYKDLFVDLDQIPNLDGVELPQ